MLCDFGEARIGKIQETGPFVQPHIYRAPEIVFEMPWGPPVDIWNVAALVRLFMLESTGKAFLTICQIWDLFEGKHLFHHLLNKDGIYDPFKHIAQITGFIGLPPKEFVRRSETAAQCFDTEGTLGCSARVKSCTSLTCVASGNWVAEKHAKIPSVSLEDVETRLEGSDKMLFLQFIRSMLRWLPEERKSAKDLLEDSWLNS